MIRRARRCLVVLGATGMMMLVACGTAAPREATGTATGSQASVTPALETATVHAVTPSPAPGGTVTSTVNALTATPPPSGDTGIAGIVTIGPTCPVERIDSPCPDRPYQARITIWRGGTIVADLRSGADGRFTALLVAGTYRVVGESGSTFPHGAEVTVAVIEGRLVPVQIRFDSGIR